MHCLIKKMIACFVQPTGQTQMYFIYNYENQRKVTKSYIEEDGVTKCHVLA